MKIFKVYLAAFCLVLASAYLGCTRPEANQSHSAAHSTAARPATSNQPGSLKLGVPTSIAAEHSELHEQLEAAVGSGGKTGAAAKVVEERLSDHFKKEEEYALPQLGLLPELAEGRISTDIDRAIELSDKLKAEMPKMLEEHKAIVEALDALAKAAKEENKAQAATFTEKLKGHAETEEQVMYPAAIIVGEYLKLKRAP